MCMKSGVSQLKRFAKCTSCAFKDSTKPPTTTTSRFETAPQNGEIAWYDLTKADKVELYVENDGLDGPRVRVFLKPIESTQREFLEKLTKLLRIEAKRDAEYREIPSGICVVIPPVYDYDLHCKAFFDGEEKDFRLLMRNKTFIYDTVALYRFDAKRYFPKELWQKLHTVYDSDYNRESDRRFPKPEGDYMPESLRRVLRYGGEKRDR